MSTTLLLADDSPTIAKILQMSLQSEPYVIRSVLTADEAIKELQSAPPFFFLVDLTLPEKDGYEFARMVRRDPNLQSVRVVLLASAFEPVDDAQFAECGADGLIKKPFDPSELRAALRDLAQVAPKNSASPQINIASLEAPSPNSQATSDFLGTLPQQEGDADSILANLLGGGNSEPTPNAAEELSLSVPLVSEQPPTFSAPVEKTGKTDRTAMLDLEAADGLIPSSESVLDLTGSFNLSNGETSVLLETTPLEPEAPQEAPDQQLSPNAQALAAFFDAEISTKAKEPPPPAAPAAPIGDETFNASLDSIDWTESPAESSLNAWSSSQPKEKTSTKFTAAPAPARTAPAAPKQSMPSGASSAGAGSFHFDTGGSTFRFSEDYIQRITKSFTGTHDETMPEKQHVPEQVFTQRSDDSQPSPREAKAPSTAAWSDDEAQRIEKIVREEVQMVVREVAEKIAWEVIPELAENLIRKELEKVLKELEPN